MRVDRKTIITDLFLPVLIMLTSRCVTVTKTIEEIEKMPVDLTPLPESLLVLPDSGLKDVISFQVDQPYRLTSTCAVDANGSLDIKAGTKKWHAGSFGMDEVQDLILRLNSMGYFIISNEIIWEKKFDVRRTYFFGRLIQSMTPSRMNGFSTYHIKFGFKNFTHEISYYNLEDDLRRYAYLQELQTLKDGIDLIDSFLESKIKAFSERPQLCCDTLVCSIITNQELDEKLQVIETPHIEGIPEDIAFVGYSVVVRLLVGPNGDILNGMIMESGGNLGFDYVVLDLVMKHKFTSPIYHGRPVCVWVAMPIRFKIK